MLLVIVVIRPQLTRVFPDPKMCVTAGHPVNGPYDEILVQTYCAFCQMHAYFFQDKRIIIKVFTCFKFHLETL